MTGPTKPFRTVCRSADRQEWQSHWDTLEAAVEHVRENVGIPVAFVQRWEQDHWETVLPVDYPPAEEHEQEA